MMYIEHTPLEDNLQDILRNHIPSSANGTASLLLEAEEAYMQLQLQAQAEIDSFRNHIPRSNATSVASAAATNYKLQAPLAPRKAYSELFANARVEEEQEEEHFELIDVFDGDETITAPEERTAQNLEAAKQQQPPEDVTVPDIDKNSDEIIFTFEEAEGDGEVEYRLIKSPKENKQQEKPIINIFKHKNSTTKAVRKSLPILKPAAATNHIVEVPQIQQRQKKRRPLPDAIPIDIYNNSSQLYRQRSSLSPQLTISARLLNGNLPIFKRSESVCSSAASSRYSYVPNENFLTYEEDNPEDNYYNNNEYGNYCHDTAEQEEEEALFLHPGQSSQMGIDIFNKLRRLLNFGSNSNHESQEGKRKRRSDHSLSDDIAPHQIKYRKVENKFPKFITHTLEDDNVDVAGTFPSKQEKQRILQQSLRPIRNSSYEMTQRRSLHSNTFDKPKMRKSIFNAPPTTHKLVRNTSYADIEFSDDDEPILMKDFGFTSGSVLSNSNNAKRVTQQATLSGVGPTSSAAAASRIYHIPIAHSRSDEFPTKLPPPPPLIEARTGSILASSLMPERKPTYADALRHNMPSAGGHLLGGRPSSSISSSGVSTSASARGLSNTRTNMWSANARSILAQEKETEEREKYQQLLEQVMPGIYGTENNRLQQQQHYAHTKYDNSLASRRRSAMLAAAAPNTNLRKSLNTRQPALSRPPLSSTINLDDEDNDDNDEAVRITLEDEIDDDDVTFTGISHLQTRPSTTKPRPTVATSATVVLDDDDVDEHDDDDDISEIIDLGDAELSVLSTCNKLKEQERAHYASNEKKRITNELPYVEPVNTLRERFEVSPHLKSNWLQNWYAKWNEIKRHRNQELIETTKVADKLTAERCAAECELHERLRKFQIVDPELLVIDDFPEPVVEEEPEFIQLTQDQQARIKASLYGSPDQVLISKFNLNITRRDIQTLYGHNWLNDEVINFYMNLLTERGETRHESHGLPRVYAMNTFFVPRLLQAGHSGVKRWTRKVDIFAMDVIPVPVHVGGVHWCMAIIHMKNRTIKYYDSMGTPNPSVLSALEQYLKDESMDKRKQSFDTSRFEVESVRDVPRQMNGSDCGVFSCMFAEYITRNRGITFAQQHMEYFRHKMILEIVQGELLH